MDFLHHVVVVEFREGDCAGFSRHELIMKGKFVY